MGPTLEVEVTPSDPRLNTPGVMELRFRRVYDPKHSQTTIERMTDEDLEKVQAAIHAHLAAG